MPAPCLTRVVCLALPLMALAACSDQPAAAPAEEREVSAADPERWTASDEGLGPIAAGTYFDRTTLAALLPDYTVSLGRTELQGNIVPVIEARRDGRQVDLAIFADTDGEHIGSIRIREPERVGGRASLGQRLGDTPLSADDCFAGEEALTGDIVCTDPQNVSLVYWVRGDFEPGEMPSATALADGEIHEIVWVPGEEEVHEEEDEDARQAPS